MDGDGHAEYAQRLCAGYKSELRFQEKEGKPAHVVHRSTTDRATGRPLLLLLLDGVAYERVRGLYDAGHFRLFRPPARLITLFPTLTDPIYDALFATGPTPGYEAGYFDRRTNRLSNAFVEHLLGRNEAWVRCLDYRLSFVEDALMYLFPRWIYPRELRRCRDVLDRQLAAGRRQVVLYILSTDGLGHMLRPDEIDRELRRLDAWIERVVYDYRGALDIVSFADHGISRVLPGCSHVRPFNVRRVLREAGLRVARRLKRPGDVVMPVFGLLDFARLHTFDAAARDQAAEALRRRPEVEIVAVRDGDRVRVFAGDAEAEVYRRNPGTGPPRYSYRTLQGDPLQLATACASLQRDGSADPDGLATPADWLRHSADLPYPLAPPRLWDAFFTVSREQPDLIISLSDRCFIGSGLLSRFVRMQGTHGGLHRRATETFIMSTSCDLPSPMDWRDVGPWLRREYDWQVTADGARSCDEPMT